MSYVVETEHSLRIAIYVRVSTKNFTQKESLKNQISFFENYVKQLGGQLVDVYTDDGISATSIAKRSELQRLIKDAENRKFDVVYVKSISRWARDTVDSLSLIRKLRSLNISLRSITENYNSLNDTDEFVLTIHSAVAQRESELSSARIKFGKKENARKGKHHGTAPYGYTKVNGVLFPHPVHSITVKKIFQLYLCEGWGVQKIANYLTEHNILTPRAASGSKNQGRKWHDSTVRLILTNAHYTGNLVQNKETTDDDDKLFIQKNGYKKRIKVNPEDHIKVSNTHEALVNDEDFQETLSKLRIRGEKKYRGRGKKSLFARIAFCADCKAGMVFKSQRKGYVCGTYQRNTSHKCSSHIIKHDKLKAMVLADLNELANQAIDMNSLVETALNRSGIKVNHLKEEFDSITQEIANIDSEIAGLTRNLVKGHITPDLFKITSDVIVKEKEVLQKRLNELNELLLANKNDTDSFSAFQTELKKFVNLKLSNEEILRQMLQTLIKKIEVFSDEKVTIHYNFKNPILSGSLI
ncbi:recombinase family protein [Priestia aryabhattai]|uniref:recombinase family protein n=1 Tax=Priestia aryabhattai TaxID=412384 RepID=UPI0035327D45